MFGNSMSVNAVYVTGALECRRIHRQRQFGGPGIRANKNIRR
jgi:hypothetical protein